MSRNCDNAAPSKFLVDDRRSAFTIFYLIAVL